MAAKKKSKKKKRLSMDELTKGYDKFMEGKEINPDGKKQFEETLKKAATPPATKRSQT